MGEMVREAGCGEGEQFIIMLWLLSWLRLCSCPRRHRVGPIGGGRDRRGHRRSHRHHCRCRCRCRHRHRPWWWRVIFPLWGIRQLRGLLAAVVVVVGHRDHRGHGRCSPVMLVAPLSSSAQRWWWHRARCHGGGGDCLHFLITYLTLPAWNSAFVSLS